MNKTNRSLKKKSNSYLLWKKFMQFGEFSGCHQLPERSFYFHGYQFPVCARCTGAIFGYIIAIPAFFLLGFFKVASFLCLIPMTLDWLIQLFKIKESNNTRRVITGILGGFGIMSIHLFIVKKLLSLLKKK